MKIPPATSINNSSSSADTDVKQTVAFHADNTVMEKEFPKYQRIPRGLLRNVRENRVHNLLDFLKRPIRVATGSWSTTQAANTELFSLDIPKVGLEQANFADKVQGFLGFRAKAIVRVQINAQRFQQGRLLMHYVPQAQVEGANWRSDVIMQSLTLKTQTPRVELDCSTITSAELEMPYVSTTTHFNTKTYTGPIGVFHCCVYSPLVSSAASTVNYTAWLRFEEIELSYPTTTFTPQSGIGEMSTMGKALKDEISGKGNLSEAEKMDPGPVSKGLSFASGLLNSFTSVPSLSKVAKPASWISAILAGAASSFGWSNPKDDRNQTRITIDTFAQAQNVDGNDNTHTIGLFNSNSVDVLPGFTGTDVDEMDISYVASIPAFYETVSWQTTNAEDAAICQFTHNLRTYGSVRNVSYGAGTIPVIDFIPATYVSLPFRFWRGSINLTIKFVKTEFHSGRLLFYWFPDPSAVASTPTDSDLQFVYKEILDIRLSNEFTVTIPWVSTKPYAESDEVLGQWGLLVLNPLVAPDTVSNTVNILLEASAGPDFEVAVPQQPIHVPIYQVPSMSPQSGFVFQGIGENEAEEARGATSLEVVDPIASSSIDSGGLDSARYCIGERLISLRQLLKRAGVYFELDVGIGVPGEGLVRNYVSPSDMTLPVFVTGSTPTLYNNVVSTSGDTVFTLIDYFDFFGSMYMYRRGGIRLRLYGGGDLTGTPSSNFGYSYTTMRSILYTRNSTVSCSLGLAGTPVGTSNWMMQPTVNVPELTGGMQIEIPQYSGTLSTINQNLMYTGATILQPYHDTNMVAFNFNYADGRYWITRQLADDGSFGFFIGVLPVARQTDLQTAGITWPQNGF